VFLPAAHLASASVVGAWYCTLQGAQIAQDSPAPKVAPSSCPMRQGPVLAVLMNRDAGVITGPGFQIDDGKAVPK
jgi:hypothetical protein